MPGLKIKKFDRPAVLTTGQAEKIRTHQAKKARKAKWELLTTTSESEAIIFAVNNGWKEKAVQIRKTGPEYTVEPFERDCSCPNILRYEDYF